MFANRVKHSSFFPVFRQLAVFAFISTVHFFPRGKRGERFRWKNERREKKGRRRRCEIYIGRRRFTGRASLLPKRPVRARNAIVPELKAKKFSREYVVRGGGGRGNYYRVIAPRETNKRLGSLARVSTPSRVRAMRASNFAHHCTRFFFLSFFLSFFFLNEINGNEERDEEITRELLLQGACFNRWNFRERIIANGNDNCSVCFSFRGSEGGRNGIFHEKNMDENFSFPFLCIPYFVKKLLLRLPRYKLGTLDSSTIPP